MDGIKKRFLSGYGSRPLWPRLYRVFSSKPQPYTIKLTGQYTLSLQDYIKQSAKALVPVSHPVQTYLQHAQQILSEYLDKQNSTCIIYIEQAHKLSSSTLKQLDHFTKKKGKKYFTFILTGKKSLFEKLPANHQSPHLLLLNNEKRKTIQSIYKKSLHPIQPHDNFFTKEIAPNQKQVSSG